MRRTSILDGVDIGTLQAQLVKMQQAYMDLSTGAKGESFSYSQGEGARSVTYTRANIGQLVQAIIALQTQIDRLSGTGYINRRPPMVPFF